MGFRRFLLRGLENIKAETFMVATAFNLRSLYRISHRRWNTHGKLGPSESVLLFPDYFSANNFIVTQKCQRIGF